MIDLSQWRASVGSFYLQQRTELETKKAMTVKCTATPATSIEVGNTCCVTFLVGVYSKYILLLNFLSIIDFLTLLIYFNINFRYSLLYY